MTKTTKTAAKTANLRKGTTTPAAAAETPTGAPAAHISEAAAMRSLPAPVKEEKAEQLGTLEAVTLPARMLAAALLAAAKGDIRQYLNGVQLTRVGDKMLRLAATNGHALLVAHVECADKLPSWLSAGVIIDREHLPTVLKLTGTAEGDEVCLAYGKNHPHVVAEIGTWATLKLATIDGRFPDLEAVIAGGSEALTHDGAVPLEAAGLDPAYVKLAAAVAEKLGAGHVRAFASQGNGASVFTFAGLPVVLYVMPMCKTAELPASVAAILAPAVRRSMAALKAHETRLLVAAEAMEGDQGEELRAKAAAFTARIKALAVASSDKALPGKPGRKPKASNVETPAQAQPEAPAADTSTEVKVEPAETVH